MALLPSLDAELLLRLAHLASFAAAVAFGAWVAAGPRLPGPPPLCPAA